MMCVPLRAKKAGIIGVAQIINKCSVSMFAPEYGGSAQGNISAGSCDFTAEDLQFLQVFAAQAAAAVVGSQAWESTMAGSHSPQSEGQDVGSAIGSCGSPCHKPIVCKASQETTVRRSK